ncbi:MAG: exodeoxyribonuclease VII small subunit [Opitutaceae bacterium]|nr:exodeoxyribonuclease VII small subunit [Opitutaceae bacterium]
MDSKKQTSANAQQSRDAQPPPPRGAQPQGALSFEQALGQLEAIVDSMESGETPLAEMLVKFEEGTKLLKVCEARLKDAEMKIELLKKQKNGDASFAGFPVADRE